MFKSSSWRGSVIYVSSQPAGTSLAACHLEVMLSVIVENNATCLPFRSVRWEARE